MAILVPARLAMFGLCLLLAGYGPGAARAEEALALVADLSGAARVLVPATRKPADRQRPLSLLQAVAPGTTLVLDERTGVTLYYASSGMAYDLKGPGRYEARATEVVALEGAPTPTSRKLNDVLKGVRLQSGRLAQAGLDMRGPNDASQPKALSPRGVVLSEGPLALRWSPGSGGRTATALLMDEDGRKLFEGTAEAGSISPPESVKLKPGRPYFWGVRDSTAPEGRMAWIEFTIADQGLRDYAAEIDRQLNVSDPAERNLRELLLAQRWRQSRSAAR
ncbi:MAG: hypothetical protein IT512_10995 [Rhodocyclaceae bacterium]|nr:hypothetical protein [Rhodocyclaceae bacterium]